MQRAEGRVRLAFHAKAGATRIETLFQEGCAKARLPSPLRNAAPEAILINTAGGLAGGDRLATEIELAAGASAVATTQACERVYRSTGPAVTVSARLRLSGGARLAWLPQETILFDGCRLERSLEADLDGNAELLAVEAFLFGRMAMGETVRSGGLHDRWRIRREGRLIFADDLRIEGRIAGQIERAAVLDGNAALATVLYAGPDPERLARIGTFVELHVEQGRGLADLDRPVAVGSAIWPHGRWRLDLRGEANHAGTTRLADRQDPMLDLAAAITGARTAAAAHGCVATSGKVHVEPNGVNAIPSHVTAWLDARGPQEQDVRRVVAAVAEHAGTAPVEESFTPDTRFDTALATRLAAVLDDAPVLATGAGHDAGILATAGVPTAMLFVRNPTGVSHSPAEYAEPADCLAGVTALAAVVRELAS